MNNPFESIEARLNGIENLILDLKHNPLENISNDNSQKLITRDEVCQLLNINKTTLWHYTKKGKLQSYGIGNRVYYKKDEVLDAVKPLKK